MSNPGPHHILNQSLHHSTHHSRRNSSSSQECVVSPGFKDDE